MRRLILTIPMVLTLVACKNKETVPESVEPPPPTQEQGPVDCCADGEDIRAKDSTLVVVVGTYETVHLYKMPKPDDMTDEEYEAHLDEKFGASHTVSVTPDSGTSLMLGIYYESDGTRDEEEIAKYDGKRVRVTGILHEATPTQMHEGIPMQTMIGPYIEVQSIELAD